MIPDSSNTVTASAESAGDVFLSFRDAILEITGRYGSESVAGFISPEISNEGAYLFQKFMRTCIGCNTVIGMQGPEIALDPLLGIYEALGTLTVTPSVEGLRQADGILVIGGGGQDEWEIVSEAIHAAHRDHGAEIILVGFGSGELRDICRFHFPVPPAGVVEILRSFLHVVNRHGGLDREVTWRDSEGFQGLAQMLRYYSPETIGKRWELDHREILKAGLLTTQKRLVSVVVGSRGFPDYAMFRTGLDALNLVLATGNLGVPGRGYYYLPWYRNTLGINLMGCSPGFLPGFASIHEESAADWFSTCWSRNIKDPPAYNYHETLKRMTDGQVKCLIYLGGHPADYLPESAALITAQSRVALIAGAGGRLDPHCHFWWPLAPLDQTSGTHVSLDKRLRIIEPDSSATGRFFDWNLVSHWISAFTGVPPAESTRDIFREMTETIPFLIGVDQERVRNENIVFQTFIDEANNLASGELEIRDLPRIRFSEILEPPEYSGDDTFHLVLRNMAVFPAGESLPDGIARESAVLTGIDPGDAARLKVENHQFVTLELPQKRLTGYIVFTDDIARGSICVWVKNSRKAGMLNACDHVFGRARVIPPGTESS